MLERTQVVGVDRPKRQFRESRTPWARWRLDVRHRRFQMKSQAKNAAARRWRLETECPGLHPEIAHERAGELDLLLTQIRDVAAIGEVGLDGSSRYSKSYDVQRGLFEAIIERSSALGGRVLSIHSRQAVNDVLAILDRHAGFGTAVMHWFTGTVKELRAAEERGCWFSIGPAAFASSSGRALAAKLPRHFVVPESDGPFARIDDKPVPPWSADLTAWHLGQAWGVSTQEAATLLSENSHRLLAIMRQR